MEQNFFYIKVILAFHIITGG